jgi:hypothetical protein
MKNRFLVPAVVAGAFTVGLGLAVALPGVGGSDGSARQAAAVVVGEGGDQYASQTAADWVGHADHVAVLTVLSEREVPPTQEEKDAGEGMIGREVTVRVDKIVWSADRPAHAAPEGTFTWGAGGWTFHGEERTVFTVADAPRYEVGHTYIEALKWEPAETDEGDVAPAQWVGLGEGSSLPYDDGRIGNGEYQGETVTAARFKAAEEEPAEATLEELMAGKSVQDLAAALAVAEPSPSPTPST